MCMCDMFLREKKLRNNCHKGIPEGGHEVMTHLSDWLPPVPEG